MIVQSELYTQELKDTNEITLLRPLIICLTYSIGTDKL